MVYIRSSFLSASRGRAVWTSASRRPEGSTLTRKLRPCGSRAANRHIQRTVGGATVSPWRQVTHDPGTSETSLLPFSTAPTLEPALSSSFFFSLRSTPFLPTRKKKRVKRGSRSSFFFSLFFLLFSLSSYNKHRIRSDRCAQESSSFSRTEQVVPSVESSFSF